jgi:hypothetical protein
LDAVKLLTGEGAGRCVYLTCGDYRKIIRILIAHGADTERVFRWCAKNGYPTYTLREEQEKFDEREKISVGTGATQENTQGEKTVLVRKPPRTHNV